MTSTPGQATWPRQLRLPGQADAPEGPVDLSTMYLVHHAFRRDLAAFAEAVPHTPLDDRPTWRALQRRWELFAEVLHHHHRAEDTWIWPVLMQKADPTEQQTLQAMEAEHEEIDPLLASCTTGLQRLVEGRATADERAALAVRVCAARESLGRHLAHEEHDAMRILQRHVSPAEWGSIETEINGRRPDPRPVLSVVPWVLHEVPPAVRREVLARAEAVPRVLWRLTHRRFERLERRAFRYVT